MGVQICFLSIAATRRKLFKMQVAWNCIPINTLQPVSHTGRLNTVTKKQQNPFITKHFYLISGHVVQSFCCILHMIEFDKLCKET